MRADAKKNRDRLLEVARDAISEEGADMSLRDIARRADVGMGTLYRHFPTREALLDALLRANLDDLTLKAQQLKTSDTPDAALISWFHDGVAFTRTFAGAVTLMAAALEDSGSALHASCSKVRAAGAHLLARAQAAGTARSDIDGTDLIAMMGAIAWVGDQAAFASRVRSLSEIITGAILGNASPRSAAIDIE